VTLKGRLVHSWSACQETHGTARMFQRCRAFVWHCEHHDMAFSGACFAFPGVDWVASRSQALFPNDGDLWGANLLEHSLAAGDPVRLTPPSWHPRCLCLQPFV